MCAIDHNKTIHLIGTSFIQHNGFIVSKITLLSIISTMLHQCQGLQMLVQIQVTLESMYYLRFYATSFNLERGLRILYVITSFFGNANCKTMFVRLLLIVFFFFFFFFLFPAVQNYQIFVVSFVQINEISHKNCVKHINLYLLLVTIYIISVYH